MKVVVYVLAFDEESTRKATHAFAKHEWARVVTLPDDPSRNKYMEGAAFLATLPERRDEWKDADFVGTLSYSAPDKIVVPDLPALCANLQGADMVALLPSSEHMLSMAVRSHPRFLEIWVPLLSKLGYSPQDALSVRMPCFMCNYWIATPARMDAFLSFYARAVHLLEKDADLQDALWDSACYGTKLTAGRVQEIYGTKHMPYHPFISERLVCAYAYLEHAAVALVPLGKREFWRRHYEAELADVTNRAENMGTMIGFSD